MNTLLAAVILTAPQTVCLDAIRPSLKDPSSARVESVSTWEPKLFTDASGNQVQVSHHTLMVNAKNSYGAYAGAKLYDCKLSPDGKRVVDIRSF